MFAVKRANLRCLLRSYFLLVDKEPCIGEQARGLVVGLLEAMIFYSNPKMTVKCPALSQVWSPHPNGWLRSGFVDTHACVSTGQLEESGAAKQETHLAEAILTDGLGLEEGNPR